MKDADHLIADALRDIAAEASLPRPVADVAWRAGRRRRTAGLAVAATSIAGAIALVLTVVVPPVTARGPASPVAPSSLARPVSITLSPVRPASAEVLATTARLLRERVALMHLPDTRAQVLGPDVVLTGPAADRRELEALAAGGVLNLRQVLLYQPYLGTAPAASAKAYGDARLVNDKTLALFHQLVCTPGSAGTWQAQAGYTAPADYGNPATQIVWCDSSGDKYALAVATVPGTQISRAVAAPSGTSNQWAVTLVLKRAAASAFAGLTSEQAARYYPGVASGNQDDQWLDTIAFVLDGNIITAPQTAGPIVGGLAQVMGNFTRVQAEELAAQVKTGALPVDFRVSTTSASSPSAASQAAAG